MDEMQKKREEALAQGYTEEEIDAFLNPSAAAQTPPATSNAPVSPYVDRSEEKLATGEYGASELAKYGLGGYGLYKAGQGIASKFGTGAPATGPVSPTTFTGGANPPFDRALAKPPVEQTPAYQNTRAITEKVREIALERVAPAMSKAAPYVRPAAGVLSALMPGNVGQNYPFPTSGPMRGREINPNTGAPWTASELQAYRAQYGS